MPPTSAGTKVKDSEYKNWLRVGLALYYLKVGLHSFIQNEVDAMHQSLLQKLYGGLAVQAPQCSSCKSKDVKQNRNTYIWKFKSSCPSHLCDIWLAELLTLHTNPTSNKIYWDNCDVTAWPFVPWECAKLYMPRGQPPANTGPAMSDSQALLTLMANCKYFHVKFSQPGITLIKKVSTIRNKVMHSGDMNLSDSDTKSFIQDILDLLEDPTQLRSLEECGNKQTFITRTIDLNIIGPEEMAKHGDDTLTLEEEEMDGDEEEMEEDEKDYREMEMIQEVIQGFENALEGIISSEDSTDKDDLLKADMCDAGTNTDGCYPMKDRHQSHETARGSTIRRSQTFSPACRPGANYICKLNRSDSDSSMPLYKKGPFQRNSLERRSLRHKRSPGYANLFGGRFLPRTSLDLELDLQASQTKLSYLTDEINRLKELKQRLETAKSKGETELPSWLTDDEQFQKLLGDADKLIKQDQAPPLSKQDRRAEQLLKRVTREVQRMKRNSPNAVSVSFREKMAFFTTVTMNVPVLPKEGSDETRMEELFNDGRVGHEV